MQKHIIPGQQLTMSELYKISTSNDSAGLVPIRTVRGQIRVTRYNDSNYANQTLAYGNNT